MSAGFEIVGGAGEAETAAIAAVIARVLRDEADARGTPSRLPAPSPWVVASRPREVPAPLPSHTYEGPSRTGVEPGPSGEGLNRK